MRRVHAKFREISFRRRIGTALALTALLIQLVLPVGAALAFGSEAAGEDPLRRAPICTVAAATADHDKQPRSGHAALHAFCPLCQSPAIAWGFLPPSALVLAGPQHLAEIVWSAESEAGQGDALAALRARGPPDAA